MQRSQSGLTVLSGNNMGTYQGNKLMHKSSGNTSPKSSQLAKPLWTDPGLKNEIDVCELISTMKKKV